MGPRFGEVGQTPAAKAAAAAWATYASTCAHWGTSEQRAEAFRKALAAERKVSRLELARHSGR